jgi:predicted TIM-barrel fold metal-dependent hydrolase
MIIDAHMHVGAWDHPDFLGRSCTVADALTVLFDAGIAGAAFLPTDQCDNPGLLAELRRAIAAGFAGPLWFVPWIRPGTADLDWVSAHAQAVAGLKIHPSLSRTRVTDPAFAAALALAEEKSWIVLVHCGRWQEMASFRYAVAAALAHPRARFLLAHAGGDTPPLATAAADLVAERRAGNVWFDISGVREYWVIERNVARLGAERYLFASDYALAHPLMYVGAIRGMALDDAARRRILGENALAILGPPLAEAAE